MRRTLEDLGVATPRPPNLRLRRLVKIGVSVAVVAVVVSVLVVHFTPHSSIQHYLARYGADPAFAGYFIPASNVRSASATWIQPNYTGVCGAASLTEAAFWTGIDGFASSTVEQIGTQLDCRDGTISSFAWYEYYPANWINITSLQIYPGDKIQASVSYSDGNFTLRLQDVTQDTSFENVSKDAGANRTSAEWFVEAPAEGNVNLTDFGHLPFLECSATIGGDTGVPDSFQNLEGSNMTNLNGSTIRATVSLVDSSNGGFTVRWLNGTL